MEMMNWEQRNLLNELIHGLRAAKQLQASPAPSSSSSSSCLTSEMKETLLQQVVSSYEKAIMMLNGSHNPTTERVMDPVVNSGKVPESPASINESPKSEEFLDVGCKDYSCKKRKMLPKWTEQVRISPERGLEGPHDDVYSWRKYGQKDILGAKYPRSYYRCTFRNTQCCWATKQVQRSDGDPTIFEVTYRGTHTCSQQGNTPPHKRAETKPNQNHIVEVVNYQNNLLDNLRTNLTVRTDGLEGHGFSFPVTPPPFYSYETFCHVGSSGPSDFTGLISTNTSTGSSPIFDVDFQFDPTAEIDTTGFPTFLHDSI
ncbi:PREDICTED: probable WRKY transcription factor 41 [Camelina sativa]|uniref:Probable WRKY transcription factor 41 n=1 Tax=Camelina sativa TaxID=90675 RepID=A0ABM0T7I7_CAMSA|nr:PREDICTED: probable WRKY transcription factor 41 [Camelina sativa]